MLARPPAGGATRKPVKPSFPHALVPLWRLVPPPPLRPLPRLPLLLLVLLLIGLGCAGVPARGGGGGACCSACRGRPGAALPTAPHSPPPPAGASAALLACQVHPVPHAPRLLGSLAQQEQHVSSLHCYAGVAAAIWPHEVRRGRSQVQPRAARRVDPPARNLRGRGGGQVQQGCASSRWHGGSRRARLAGGRPTPSTGTYSRACQPASAFTWPSLANGLGHCMCLYVKPPLAGTLCMHRLQGIIKHTACLPGCLPGYRLPLRACGSVPCWRGAGRGVRRTTTTHNKPPADPPNHWKDCRRPVVALDDTLEMYCTWFHQTMLITGANTRGTPPRRTHH